MYSLHRWKAVIILFPFRYGICEITSHMCPARAAFDIRQIVITLVSVGLQISTEPLQERCCMELCPCLCVMMEQDRRKPIFSTAEEPHPGICFRIALRLIQSLNKRPDKDQRCAQPERAVKIIINMTEVILGTVNDPVSKRSPAQWDTQLLPFRFLPV